MADTKDAKPRLVRAAVAPRHTVMAGPRPQIAFGPGQLVELPAEEAAYLTARGFLLEPGAPPMVMGPGPTYGQDGNMITSPANGG